MFALKAIKWTSESRVAEGSFFPERRKQISAAFKQDKIIVTSRGGGVGKRKMMIQCKKMIVQERRKIEGVGQVENKEFFTHEALRVNLTRLGKRRQEEEKNCIGITSTNQFRGSIAHVEK